MNQHNNKLPPEAKMVFKGEIFEVWQWEQKLYDGSFQTFERLRRPDTTRAIVVSDDNIVVLEQEQPDRPKSYVSLPGGRREENEDPLEATKRELLEETGYVSDDWELWREEEPSNKMVWTIYTYIARGAKRAREPKLDAGERIKTRLISFDELISLVDNPRFHENDLKKYLVEAKYNLKTREEFYNLLFRK